MRRNRRASRWIPSGTVAENSSVCRVGRASSPGSSRCPPGSPSTASRRTRRARRSARDRAAASRAAGDRARAPACRRRSGRRAELLHLPPHRRAAVDGDDGDRAVAAQIFASSAATCSASSRVGSRMIACTNLSSALTMPFANGMPNAAVFPDPVRDCTIRSRPAVISGNVAACTGIGSVKPISSTARRTSACRPSSANEGPLGAAGGRRRRGRRWRRPGGRSANRSAGRWSGRDWVSSLNGSVMVS